MDQGNHTTRKGVDRLDVEDEDARHSRINSYLEKLNASTKPKDTNRPFGIPQFDFGDRSTFPVKPPTELLSRVQAFLPQMEASNALLSQRAKESPSSIDIEQISEGMEQYIEMVRLLTSLLEDIAAIASKNLGLGVFEDRSNRMDQDESEDSEMSTSSSSSSDRNNIRVQEDDFDYDSDESSEIITSFVPSRPIKPLPRRVFNKPRPDIVVLNEPEEKF